MGLVVLAKFSELGEAQVARSALESAGLFAIVQDEGVGHLNYLWRQFLQGFRLCVASSEYDDARAVLIHAVEEGKRAEPSDIPQDTRTAPWIVSGMIFAVIAPYYALLMEATRRRPTAARWAVLVIAAFLMTLPFILLIGQMTSPRDSYYY